MSELPRFKGIKRFFGNLRISPRIPDLPRFHGLAYKITALSLSIVFITE